MLKSVEINTNENNFAGFSTLRDYEFSVVFFSGAIDGDFFITIPFVSLCSAAIGLESQPLSRCSLPLSRTRLIGTL